jgi:hypothetical protein
MGYTSCLRYTLTVDRTLILLGTSSFIASGWNGSFCPRGLKPSDCLGFYAERFHTVEVDSTFYACSTARTVDFISYVLARTFSDLGNAISP